MSLEPKELFATLKHLFCSMDTNGDNKIDRDEFAAAMKKLHVKKARQDKIWKQLDNNGDGVVTLKEMCGFYGVIVNDDNSLTEIEDVFEKLGDDGIQELLQLSSVYQELAAEEAKREAEVQELLLKSKAPSPAAMPSRRKSTVQQVKVPTQIKQGAEDPEIMFLQSADMGDKGGMIQYLKQDKDPNFADDKGETALHKVVRLGLLDMAEKLVQANIELDYKDKSGKSAIFFATEYGHDKVLALLLKSGADITVESNEGWTVLHQAVHSNKEDCIKTILAHPVKVRINHQDKTGRTVLHIASYRSEPEILELLLRAGASADVKDNQNNKASGLAQRTGRRKSFDLLENSELAAELGARGGSTGLSPAMQRLGNGERPSKSPKLARPTNVGK